MSIIEDLAALDPAIRARIGDKAAAEILRLRKENSTMVDAIVEALFMADDLKTMIDWGFDEEALMKRL